MFKETSAGGIVFIREGNEIIYLLLYKKAHDHYKELWGFPRGLVEKDEDLKETAIREIKEETGLQDIKIISGFEEILKWFYKKERKLISKEAVYFLFESKSKDIKLSNEHDDFRWCNYEVALKLLKFDKNILGKANEFLTGGLNRFF